MKITRVGLDLAKRVFQVHGVDELGRAKVRKQLSRAEVLEFFAQLPPCIIGMEACGGAHYWARELRAGWAAHGTRWHRTNHCHHSGGQCGQRAGVQERPTVRRMARLDAATVLKRRYDAFGSDHQAWRSIFAHAAGAWRS